MKKKVFLSVPMRGRTKENIEKSLEKMREYTRIALGYDIEFINTVVEEKPPYNTENEAMWYLGKSIQLLSQADVLVCVDRAYTLNSSGCEIEKAVFKEYHSINIGELNFIELPLCFVIDLDEIDELYEKNYKICDCEPAK